MDGYEVCRELRKNKNLCGTQFIALTGYGQEEDVRRSKDAGFQVHLTKPVDPSLLARILSGEHSDDRTLVGYRMHQFDDRRLT